MLFRPRPLNSYNAVVDAFCIAWTLLGQAQLTYLTAYQS